MTPKNEQMVFKHIWTDEAIEIVKNNWGQYGPKEIRVLVIEYCKNRAKAMGRDSYQIPSVGGIVWQACNLGIIGENEKDSIIKSLKRTPLDEKTRARIISRDNGKCVVCHSKKVLQVDHILPVFMGGLDNDENLQTLCNGCHFIKGLNTLDCRNLDGMVGGVIDLTPTAEGVMATKIYPVVKDGYFPADIILRLYKRRIDKVLAK